MAIFPELVQQESEKLQHWFLDPSKANKVPKEDRPLWLEEISARIAKTGTKGVDFLLNHVNGQDEARTRAILIALSLRKNFSDRMRTRICDCVQTFLLDSRPLVVAEAIDTLRLLQCETSLGPIVWLINHPSPYVVGSVLRFLASHLRDKAAPILEFALKSGEPIVRQNAIDELDDLSYTPALPKIRELLTDPDANVRLAALTAVKNLEGE
jgi:hypothetical protein